MTDVRASGSPAAPAKTEPATTETTAGISEAAGPFGPDGTEATESFSGGTSAPPEASAGWLRWGWRQLTSMRTALILLFLLAVGAIPGSILPQQGTDPASVQQYFTSHPSLAPWLNRLGLFNVFAQPWFAAIYLLLFASLIGCVVPRTFRLVGSARTPPPRAPRNLKRLPHSTTYDCALPPEAAVQSAAGILGGRRFRLRRPAAGDSGQWVSAEKGYVREVGNLLFHLSLVGVLVSIALGGLFGYKADQLLVQGDSFSDTVSALAEFNPGRLVTASDLAPFSITLDNFSASYITSGQNEGQPSSFKASVTYTATPGGPAHQADIEVNHPLSVDSTKVYLIGHGYAPVFKVTGPGGKVAYEQATPFIPANASTMLSDGVVKASNANLGFMGVFVPTAIDNSGTLESIFPAANYPVVSLIGYSGNLGMNSGVPQSVYTLDTTGMTKISGSPHIMLPGQTWTLPDGKGSITFVGVQQWVSLAITHDPGQVPALIFGMLALAGLLLSFFVRRRRIFVRAVPAASGAGSVVTIGGLTRTDASGGFEEEFAELAYEIATAGTAGSTGAAPPEYGSPGAADAAAGDDKPEPNNQSETEA
jgi:cytochrome c biogenesis protein